MSSTAEHWLIVINAIVNGGNVIVCLGRLAAGSTEVRAEVRAYYTLLLSGSLAYGLQSALFGYIPTPAGVFFTLCVFVGLLTSKARWREGPPDDVMKSDHCPTVK